MDRREFIAAAGAATAASAAGTASAGKGRREGPPNVVLVITDDHKATSLACYGNKQADTPSTDRMAAGGVTFQRPYCNFPKCVPTRASIFTGRYPHVEGHRTLPGFMLRPDEPHLGTLLQKYGYHTALIGKNHLVEKEYRQASFNEYPRVAKSEGRLVGTPAQDDTMFRSFYRGRWEGDLSKHHEARIAQATCRFLRENKDRPFFVSVNFHLTHTPYIEFAPWAERYRKAGLEPPLIEPLKSTPPVLRHYREVYNLESLTKDDWRTIAVAYQSMTSFVDQQFGVILDAIDKLDLADHTMVLFVGDQGDFAGEHGCVEKWDTVFYDCLTRSPLLIRMPEGQSAGRRIPSLVEYVDIAPTILEACGFEVPWWMMGKSMMPVIRGETDRHKEAVFCSGGVEWRAASTAPHHDSPEAARMKPNYYWKQKAVVEDPRSMARAKMVRTDRYKYIFRVYGAEELYDMEKDPGEFKDIAGEPAMKPVLDEMRLRLMKWLIETETDRPYLEKLFA